MLVVILMLLIITITMTVVIITIILAMNDNDNNSYSNTGNNNSKIFSGASKLRRGLQSSEVGSMNPPHWGPQRLELGCRG